MLRAYRREIRCSGRSRSKSEYKLQDKLRVLRAPEGEENLCLRVQLWVTVNKHLDAEKQRDQLIVQFMLIEGLDIDK